MKRTAIVACFITLALSSANAAEKTVALAVDGMTCASCPYIVKQSLLRVAGVEKVEVSFEMRRALVTFDDSRTTVAALAAATSDVGFLSHPAQ